MKTTLEKIEAWVGQRLPEGYRGHLVRHEEDVTASDLVLLYGWQSFLERNRQHQVMEYCPGFVTIGNDSGGRELLLELRSDAVSIVDAGSMQAAHADPVADEFPAWFATGCPLAEEPETDADWLVPPLTPVVVYLETPPTKLTNLLALKKILGIDTSIAELKAAANNTPSLIAEGLVYAGARVVCEKGSAVENCLGIRLASDHANRLPL